MPKTGKKKKRGVQFTQIQAVSRITQNVSEAISHRDYSTDFVQSALNKADVDPKNLISFVTHYIFIQLNAQQDDNVHK